MKISRYSDSKPTAEVEGVARRDLLTAEDGVPLVGMNIVEISTHVSTPSHYHPYEHEIFIVSGKGLVVGEHGSTPIGEGSVIFIPASETHCFVNMGSDTLRFISVEPLQKGK